MVHGTLYFVSDSFIANVPTHVKRIDCVPPKRQTSSTSPRTRMRHMKLRYSKKKRLRLRRIRSKRYLVSLCMCEKTLVDILSK